MLEYRNRAPGGSTRGRGPARRTLEAADAVRPRPTTSRERVVPGRLHGLDGRDTPEQASPAEAAVDQPDPGDDESRAGDQLHVDRLGED